MGLIKRIGRVHKVGCKIEELKILPKSARDVVENTNKRSVSAPLKPKKKKFIQIFGFFKMVFIILPRKIITNHKRQEKKDKAKQRRVL